jgi:hypothetical protein
MFINKSEIRIIPAIISDHKNSKLEINQMKNLSIFILLKNQWVDQKGKTLKYLVTNDNGTTVYQNL